MHLRTRGVAVEQASARGGVAQTEGETVMDEQTKRMHGRDRVVRYQTIIGGAVDLCREHAARPPEWMPELVAVQYGQHMGWCDACMRGRGR